MSTMREVAAQAGVSAKTVSRVFNNDPHVLPETRRHVEAVMQQLNYVPNVLATTFRSGRSSAIGVAVPDIVDPFFAEIARSIDSSARERNMATVVTSIGGDPERERAILESLLSRRLAGLVVAPVGTDHSWLKSWQVHTPIVFVDRAPVGLSVDTFHDNDRQGGRLATQHLLDHGHRRIAYVGDSIDLSTEANRLAGYGDALDEAGIEADESLVAGRVCDEQSAARSVAALKALPDPPTAIFSGNARSTMLLVGALKRVPISLVGFGDFPMANQLEPSVTVIDQDPVALGALAAERVFARMADPKRRLRKTNILDVSLVERESCQPRRKARR